MLPDFMKNSIQEFRPLFYSRKLWIPLSFMFLLGIIIRTFNIRRAFAMRSDALLALTGIVLALNAAKFSGVFALFALPYVTRVFTRSLALRFPYLKQTEALLGPATMILLSLLFTFALVVRYPSFESKGDPGEVARTIYPIEACRALANHAEALSREEPYRVLTHFNNGGWCRFSAHQAKPSLDLRVTTDGRTQFVPEERLKKADELFNIRNDWRETLKAWSPDAAVVGKDRPLAELFLTENKTVLYKDENFYVFTNL